MEQLGLLTADELLVLLFEEMEAFKRALQTYPLFERNQPEIDTIRKKLTAIRTELLNTQKHQHQ